MMENKLLPIGTIIETKNANKKAIIVGFRGQTSDNDKIYDYIGFTYPEGFISKDIVLMFNNDDIAKVYYIGYAGKEEREFKTDLYEYIGENGD